MQPPTNELLKTRVQLDETPTGYVSPRPGGHPVDVRLDEIPELRQQFFYASAISRISQAIVKRLNDLGLIGVTVLPLDVDWQNDRRPRGQTDLHVVITTSVVRGVRTRATGTRFGESEADDNEAHKSIVERSPLQPGDLLRLDALNAYASRLSRHPGRRVDIAVGREERETEGGADLEYIVHEKRTWRVHSGVANTGTDQTDKWRYNFGFVDYQLSGHDDILRLNYATAAFEASHAVLGSYEAPLLAAELWRWSVSGGYSEYTASDVGLQNSDLSGKYWTAGGNAIWNVYQHGDFFLDLFVGATVEEIEVENKFEFLGVKETGRELFLLPRGGVKYEGVSMTHRTWGSLELMGTDTEITGADKSDLEKLGRADPDEQWVVLRWNLSYYTYLEPLLWRDAWEDTKTPGSTLAHEVALHFRGQYSFGRRLIPNFLQVAGGLYTVRGYPESEVAGDTAVLGSVEYRCHLPRLFRIDRNPESYPWVGTFRVAPQHAYGQPDWDLILKAFVDVGATYYEDVPSAASSLEDDNTLLGTGVGAELVIKDNLTFRVDWGVALIDLKNDEADAGSNRLHIMLTVAF